MAWKNRGKKGKKGKKKPPAAAVAAAGADEGAKGYQLAIEYLAQWTEHDQGGAAAWKFSKTRQSHLLRNWPSRDRMPSASFKQFLVYCTKLPESCRQRTIEQAQKEAQRAEEGEREAQKAADAAGAGDGDGDGEDGGDTLDQIEEQIAVFKIQRARALKVMQALVGES